MGILKKSRKGNRLILLYKELSGKSSLPRDDLTPLTWTEQITTQWHFRHLQLAHIFVKTASCHRPLGIDWNNLPESVISSAEITDDCVATLTSLVTARD